MNVAFEEQNAVLQRHTQSMSSARERLEQELALEERRTLALQQQLQAVRQALTASFASLPVPGAEAPPTPSGPPPPHPLWRAPPRRLHLLAPPPAAASLDPCSLEPLPQKSRPAPPPAVRLRHRMTPPCREQSTRPPSLPPARAGLARDPPSPLAFRALASADLGYFLLPIVTRPPPTASPSPLSV